MSARFSDKLVIVSYYDRQKGLDNHIGKENKYRLIRYGVDYTEFNIKDQNIREELGINPKDLAVGMIACFKPQKSLRDFIRWPFRHWHSRKTELKELDKNKVKERWVIVEDLYNHHDFRATIIEADKIIEYTLEHMNFEGDNYVERLKSAKPRLSESVFNSLWEARRSRNRAVHEMENEATSFEAKSVKDKIKRALGELNV